MIFLQPAYLYGLFALAIPIIIHIFNLRTARKIVFTHTALLSEIKASNKSKVQLRQILILIARLLFILFLVLAFAQPVWRENTQNKVMPISEKVVVFLDNSYSMSRRTSDGNTALDNAVLACESILKNYPIDTRFKLITHEFAPSSNFFFSKNEIEDQLTEISFTATSRQIGDIIDRADLEGGTDFYFLSDFQKNLQSSLDISDSLAINLIPFRYARQGNVYVDTAFLSNPYLLEGTSNDLHIVLHNDGREDVQQLIVRLNVDSVNVGTINATIPAQSTEEVVFPLKFTGRASSGVVTFEDYPVLFDNTFYLNLSANNTIKVAVVADGEIQQKLNALLGNDELFNARFFDPGNVNYADLEETDVLIISEVFQSQLYTAVVEKVAANGGSVVFIPGSASFSSYGITGSLRNGELSRVSLAPLDYNNPFFSNIFEEEEQRINMPEAVPVMAVSGLPYQLLNFQNGDIFLGYRPLLNGRLYAFSTPLYSEYSNFLTHALSIPVFYKIAFQAISSSTELYIRDEEQVITIPAPSDNRGDQVAEVVGGEMRIIPQQRYVGNQLSFTFEDPLDAGYYNVVMNDEKLAGLAVNLSTAESANNPFSDEELKTYFSNFKLNIMEYSTEDEFNFSLQRVPYQGSLWKLMLILSIISLLGEMAIIKFLKYPGQ